MLALIAIACGDFTTANRNLDQLAQLVAAGPHTAFADRCPETLAILEAVRFSKTRNAFREMAYLCRTDGMYWYRWQKVSTVEIVWLGPFQSRLQHIPD